MLTKPTRILGLLMIVVGVIGIIVLMNAGDLNCNFASEVFAQLRLCGSEYATEVREMRVVPVAIFVGFVGAGLLLVTR